MSATTSSNFWVLINTGHGWVQDTSYAQPTYTFLDANNNTQTASFLTNSDQWRAMEVNGDGLVDFVRLWTISGSPRKVILVNNGHGWTQNDSLFSVGNYIYTDQNNTQQS